ncbi:MAG: hypothetical protein ACRD12_14600 [Acidimicrobiales bacterium]
MRFWHPEPDTSQLVDWWLPLTRFARRAFDEGVPWLILLDEWSLRGRSIRTKRPDVWEYVHEMSRGGLQVDDSGQPYRFIPNATGPSLGRFKEISVRQAVWAARLPDVGVSVEFHRPALHLVGH